MPQAHAQGAGCGPGVEHGRYVAREVPLDHRDGAADAAADARDDADQQRHQPSGRWPHVPAAQRHHALVDPAADLGEPDAFDHEAEVGGGPADAVVECGQQDPRHREERLRVVAGLAAPEARGRVDVDPYGQRGDGTGLQQEQPVAGQRPLNVLGQPQMPLHPAGQVGHRDRSRLVQDGLVSAAAGGQAIADRPLLRREPLTALRTTAPTAAPMAM
jgi:hypothetical protein